MSECNIEVVQLGPVTAHPNADRLEIAQVLGTECCVQKGTFKEGDLVLWFPPNLLIPEPVAEKLGVANYLKSCAYPRDLVQSHCRVAACRLRGVPSFGFVVALEDAKKAAITPDSKDGLESPPLAYFTFNFVGGYDEGLKPGDNVDAYFGAVKYVPPAVREPGLPKPKGWNGDAANDHENFHRYTDIQNYYKYAKAFEDGVLVRITEKLHGSNARMGLVAKGDGEFEFMCGSNKVNWKPVDAKGNTPLWWRLLTESVVELLTHLCDEQHSVVIFGEVYGPGVQDMDYGVTEDVGFRVFDIAVNRQYLDWDRIQGLCIAHEIETVPLLYVGPFSREVLLKHTDGPTAMCPPGEIRAKFKGREGVVVTALKETFSPYLRSRLTLKSVSADYHDRKGAQDNA